MDLVHRYAYISYSRDIDRPRVPVWEHQLLWKIFMNIKNNFLFKTKTHCQTTAQHHIDLHHVD